MCRTKSAAKNRVAGMVQRRGSLSMNRPEIAAEWDTALNQLTPDEVTVGSNKTAHWICSNCGFKWKTIIAYRTSNPKCPNCKHSPNEATRQ